MLRNANLSGGIDHGSLTAAGVFLGYTQSGITRMINALEEEVGSRFL